MPRTIRSAAAHAVIFNYTDGKTVDVSAEVESYNISASIYTNTACLLSIRYKTKSYDAILRNANVGGSGPFALRSLISVYVRHPFIDDLYTEAFFGEVKGYSTSLVAHSNSITVRAVGFMDAADKIIIPLSLPLAAAGITMDAVVANATGGVQMQKADSLEGLRELWSSYMNQQSETKTLETYIGLLMSLAGCVDTSGSYNTTIVQKRIALLGDVHEEPAAANLLVGKLLANKPEVVSFGATLRAAAQYMLGECFAAPDGSLVVKPPAWNCGVPKSNFVHSSVIQAFHHESDLTRKVTRALVYGSQASTGFVGTQNNSAAIYESIMIPVVFYNDSNGVVASASMMPGANLMTDWPGLTSSMSGYQGAGGDGGAGNTHSSTESDTSILEKTGTMSDFERKFGVQCVKHHAPQLYYQAGADMKDYNEKVALPFARFLVDSMNLAVDTCTLTLCPGMPWLKLGFNMAVDPGGVDKVYYVVSTQTSGSMANPATTMVSGVGGCTLSGGDFAKRLDNNTSHACAWLKLNDGKVATYAGALQTNISAFGDMADASKNEVF